MVEVFKTNISRKREANAIYKQLKKCFADGKISFDLDDCERILRVECATHIMDIEKILAIFAENGFTCAILPDDTQSENLNGKL